MIAIVLSDQVFTNNGATSIKVENSAAGTMGVNAAGVSASKLCSIINMMLLLQILQLLIL